jgi:hypothetical protein
MREPSEVSQFERFFRDPRLRDEDRLHVGLRGIACRKVRVALHLLGYESGPGDEYDARLEDAVTRFQTAVHHTNQDGVCGRTTRRLLAQAVLKERGASAGWLLADPREETRSLRELKPRLPGLAADLDAVERLYYLDVPGCLNRTRSLTESALKQLCVKHQVPGVTAKATVGPLIGALCDAGRLPRGVALFLNVVQMVANPGSHHQEFPLSATHARMALVGLVGFLEWLAGTA